MLHFGHEKGSEMENGSPRPPCHLHRLDLEVTYCTCLQVKKLGTKWEKNWAITVKKKTKIRKENVS